jgi:hypothetical protein
MEVMALGGDGPCDLGGDTPWPCDLGGASPATWAATVHAIWAALVRRPGRRWSDDLGGDSPCDLDGDSPCDLQGAGTATWAATVHAT